MVLPATPESFDDVIGHASAVAFFRDAVTRAALPHALLFTGPSRVGKRAIALRIASALLGADNLGAQPDFTLVARQADPKTGKLRAGIGIDQVRAAIVRLSMSAFGGGWKACIVDGVDGMTDEAASAILKMLEESRGKTLIVLIAESSGAVLPTMRSRCQSTAFSFVPASDIAAALRRRGTDPDTAAQAAVLADGRPGLALQLAADPTALESVARARDLLFAFASQPVAERWTALDRVIPPKTPFNEASVRAAEFLDGAVSLFRAALLAAASGDAPADPRCLDWARLGSRRVAAAIEEAACCKSLLADNVNPRTVLERFAGAF